MNELIQLSKTFSAHSVEPYPLAVSHGNGVYVYDFDGKKYLDMVSGISVASFGHKHPRLINALITQANRIAILSRLFVNQPLAKLLETMCKLTGMDRGLPMSSGAEAVETAIKISRKWGYVKKKIPENSAEIIICNDNFHGRTTTVISMSSFPKYKENFGPLTPGFKLIPFNDAQALENAITPNTTAFIVEPIQGEAGVIIPSPGYLKACQDICRKNNVLFIVDEIQTGLGRTGKFTASEHEGIEPDGMTFGKALGGGLLPISLFLAKEHLMEVIQPGDHGSTFGGNPLASYVAYEAVNTLLDENLSQHSAIMGNYFLKELQKISSPAIKTIRGKGLFIAIEIDSDLTSTRTLCENLLNKGLLAIETRGKALRLLPPLIITKKQIDKAVEIIRQAFNEIPVH